MTDGPITNPHHQDAYEIAQDPLKFRLYVIDNLRTIRAWQDSHEKEDRRQFGDIDKRLGSVSSSVNEYDEIKQQAVGIKKAITGVVIFGAAIWGVVAAVMQLISWIKGTPQ